MKMLSLCLSLLLYVIFFSAYAMDPGSSASVQDSDGYYPPEPISDDTKSDSSIIHISHPIKLAPILAQYTALGPRLMVLFDVDDTLGRLDNPLLRDEVYGVNAAIAATVFSQRLSQRLKQDSRQPGQLRIDPYTNRLFRDHLPLMQRARMCPLDRENTWKALIDELYAHSAIVGLVTSRSGCYDDITHTQLQRDLGIDLDKTLDAINQPGLKKIFESPPELLALFGTDKRPMQKITFSHAGLFCGDNPKAIALYCLLADPKIAFPTPEKIIVVDDKAYHLEGMVKLFGDKVVPIYLHPSDTHLHPDYAEPITRAPLVQNELQLRIEDHLPLVQRALETARNILGLNIYSLIEALFKNLQFPRSQQLSHEQIDQLITTLLGESLSPDTRTQIGQHITRLQKTIRSRALPFTFYGPNNEYLAIYTEKQISKKEAGAADPAYNDPIVLPVSLLYPCIKNYLIAKYALIAGIRGTVPRYAERTASHLDLATVRSSPPSSPGPATSHITPLPPFQPTSP